MIRINGEPWASIRQLGEADEARRGPAGYPRRPSFIVDSYQSWNAPFDKADLSVGLEQGPRA